MALYQSVFSTPIGFLRLTSSDTAISNLELVSEQVQTLECNQPILLEACSQLQAYLSGQMRSFDLPLDLSSGTTFQRSIWQVVEAIPYGETVSYSELARKIDNPGSVRAIGRANGANPIPIIVPCHRVIGSNGSLTGYVYGTDVKRQLLALENPDKWGSDQLTLSLT